MLSFTSSQVPVTRHLKILVYGGPSSGKTHFALHAPAPLVIDTESSSDAFRGRDDVPEFHVAKSAEPAEILKALEGIQQRGSIQSITPETIVIDSFSVLWQVRQEAGQKKAERNSSSPDQARVSFYEWGWIKRPIQRMYTQLVNMQQHVILTAREKTLYEEIQNGSKTELKAVGFAPDIERNAEYVFDLVLRLYVENGQRKAEVQKTRFAQFQTGQIINAPEWSMFEPLAMTGEEAGTIPDVEQAAESESREPAKWLTESGKGKARAWFVDDLGLSDTDVNAALDCENWEQTHHDADEFKALVQAYVDRAIEAEDKARATIAAGQGES